MIARPYPGSPADDQLNLFTALGQIAVYVVIVAVLVAAVIALYDLGVKKASADSFAEGFLPECAEVADRVAAVDWAMAERQVQR